MAEKNTLLNNSLKSSEKESQINFSEISDDTQCIINIEIKKGQTKSLKINFDSDPNELAYSFCHENNLDYKSLNSLANKIKTIKETILSNSKELRVSSIKFNKSLICDSQTNKNDNYKSSKTSSLKNNDPINNGSKNFKVTEHSHKNTLSLTHEKQNSAINNINNSDSNSINHSNNKIHKNNIMNNKINEMAKTTFVINQTIQRCMTIIEKEEHPSKTVSNVLESGNISGFNNITNINNNTNNDTPISLTNININNTFNNNTTNNNKNSYTGQKINKNPSVENGSEFNLNSANSSNNDVGNNNNKIKQFVTFVDKVNNRINARINSNNFCEDNGAKNNSDIQYDKILTDYEDQINEKEINISKIDDNSLNNHVNKNSLTNSDIFGDYIDATHSNNYSNNINNNLTNNYTFNNNYNKNENNEKKNDLFYSIKKEVNISILPSIDDINLKKQQKINSINQYNLNSCSSNNINLLFSKIENLPRRNLEPELNTINVGSIGRNNILKNKNMEISYTNIKKNRNNYTSNNDNIKFFGENDNTSNEQVNTKRSINYLKESIYPSKSTVLSNTKKNNTKAFFNSIDFSFDEKEINNNYLTKPNKLTTSKKNNSNYSNFLKDYTTESGGNLTKNYSKLNTIQNSTTKIRLKEFYHRIPNSQRFNTSNKLTLSNKKSIQLCLKNIYNGCGSLENKSIDYDVSNTNRFRTEIKSLGTKKQMKNFKNIMSYNKNANSICSSVIHEKNRFSTEYNRLQSNRNDNFYKKIKTNTIFASSKKIQKNNRNGLMNNLLNKNEIIKAFNNVFCFISKDNNYLDVFSSLNRKSIPSDIFEPVQFIVKSCNQKQRFISINEFSAKGVELFDKLNLKDQILILNFLN